MSMLSDGNKRLTALVPTKGRRYALRASAYNVLVQDSNIASAIMALMTGEGVDMLVAREVVFWVVCNSFGGAIEN